MVVLGAATTQPFSRTYTMQSSGMGYSECMVDGAQNGTLPKHLMSSWKKMVKSFAQLVRRLDLSLLAQVSDKNYIMFIWVRVNL